MSDVHTNAAAAFNIACAAVDNGQEDIAIVSLLGSLLQVNLEILKLQN